MAKKRLKDSAGQLNWDVDRGRELAMLRHVKLPVVQMTEGKGEKRHIVNVTPRDMIDVLRVIDDHGQRCWPSTETIAAEARMSRRTVARGIKALQSLDLLCVMNRRHDGHKTSNLYSINWTSMARMKMRAELPEAKCHSGTQVVPCWQKLCATVAHKAPPEAPIEPPPPTLKSSKAQPANPWKAAAAAFKEAGIGSALSLARQLERAGLEPSVAIERCGAGLMVIRERPHLFRSAVGALVHFIREGSWPREGVELQSAPKTENLDRYWPAVMALTDEERMKLLPGDPERDDYIAFGPSAQRTKTILLDAYVRRGLHEREFQTTR